jgi:hypothetical protein
MKIEAIKALMSAQSDMGAALKKSTNPHFKSKYADLTAVQDACVEPLHSHGFAVIQPNGQDESGMFVDTIFLHESGETFQSRVYLVVDKNNMQGVGSAITYARRYGLMGLAGIAPEDDDGNAAAAAPNKTAQELQDAWRDGIEDSLTESATPIQKAQAYADAIIKELKEKRSISGLDNIWNKRGNYIKSFEAKPEYSDLFADVVDAYESTKNEITERKAA